MATKKKTADAAKAARYAVTKDGQRLPITGEQGRYWLCGDTQVRKSRASLEEEEIRQKQTGKAEPGAAE